MHVYMYACVCVCVYMYVMLCIHKSIYTCIIFLEMHSHITLITHVKLIAEKFQLNDTSNFGNLNSPTRFPSPASPYTTTVCYHLQFLTLFALAVVYALFLVFFFVVFVVVMRQIIL